MNSRQEQPPAPASKGLPLWLASEATLPQLLAQFEPHLQVWVRANAFTAERYRVLGLPGEDGALAGAIAGLGAAPGPDSLSLWDGAALAERLPNHAWRLVQPLSQAAATRLWLGWRLGSQRLQNYRSLPKAGHGAQLERPAGADAAYAEAAASALNAARNLINAPPNLCGPDELQQAAEQLSQRFNGQTSVCIGPKLATEYPLVEAVGRGSPRAPRLIDCRWRNPGKPRVTLVGKGVCFDSGGLDIKPPAGMLLMKKDMGGAACALALAELLLAMRAPIELRLLIPAVENAVDGASFRPGDVCTSRKGLTVEIGNTDAEGRLILADALTEADGDRPDLLIDMATLTGAARTALGPELPAVFSPDAALARSLHQLAEEEEDPLWPLPLWAGYDEELASRVADMNNVSSGAFAGAIIAALFLKRFVTATSTWLHVDLYAWNPKERPGRPLGAEAQCVRALYRLIRQRCG
ncbi:MAG TPA: hypothetical protein VMI92_01690 [Steroidobacteraceae bacterium]|nr:hypothetical protein [Steroidobacteraceae bacterium]